MSTKRLIQHICFPLVFGVVIVCFNLDTLTKVEKPARGETALWVQLFWVVLQGQSARALPAPPANPRCRFLICQKGEPTQTCSVMQIVFTQKWNPSTSATADRSDQPWSGQIRGRGRSDSRRGAGGVVQRPD